MPRQTQTSAGTSYRDGVGNKLAQTVLGVFSKFLRRWNAILKRL
jgi:hypothetical protein